MLDRREVIGASRDQSGQQQLTATDFELATRSWRRVLRVSRAIQIPRDDRDSRFAEDPARHVIGGKQCPVPIETFSLSFSLPFTTREEERIPPTLVFIVKHGALRRTRLPGNVKHSKRQQASLPPVFSLSASSSSSSLFVRSSLTSRPSRRSQPPSSRGEVNICAEIQLTIARAPCAY